MNTASPRPFRHVYHLGLARLLPLPLVWTLVVGLLLVAPLSSPGAEREEWEAILLVCGAFTLIMLPFFAIVWQSRLVLTPDGIAHHQFGYTVRSTWGNLEKLVLQRGSEALILREPGTRSRLLRNSIRLLPYLSPAPSNGMFGDLRALSAGRLILLTPFMAHFKRGPLHDDLKRFAPHLFVASP